MIKNLSEVEGFEEYSDYSITSDGDVVSHKFGKDRVLKKTVNSSGYLMVSIYNCKNNKKIYIHTIVLRAFCEGYSPELEGDHINFIRSDNRAKNLQYLTHTENIQKSLNKPVVQLTLEGELVRIWESLTQAKKVGGFNQGNISSAISGRIKTHAGFKWKYAE